MSIYKIILVDERKGFAMLLNKTATYGKVRGLIEDFLAKRIGLDKDTFDIVIKNMGRRQRVKDIVGKKIFVKLEEIIDNIPDEIVEINCSICYTEKDHPEGRCYICGWTKTDVVIH